MAAHRVKYVTSFRRTSLIKLTSLSRLIVRGWGCGRGRRGGGRKGTEDTGNSAVAVIEETSLLIAGEIRRTLHSGGAMVKAAKGWRRGDGGGRERERADRVRRKSDGRDLAVINRIAEAQPIMQRCIFVREARIYC